MPVMIHLTPAKYIASVRRAGLKACPGGPGTPDGVFCMPVLPDYFASHQWLRELKRCGHRTFVAVDFRLPSDEPVWVGHYSRNHVEMTAGRVAGMIMRLADARGFEVVVARPVRRSEIIGVRNVRQVVGWRYLPDAHGRRPCPCRMCLSKGTIKSRRLRKRLDPTGEMY